MGEGSGGTWRGRAAAETLVAQKGQQRESRGGLSCVVKAWYGRRGREVLSQGTRPLTTCSFCIST